MGRNSDKVSSLSKGEEGSWRPWRDVVYIAEQEGGRKGKCWVLTLSCGHIKCVAQPVFKIWKIFHPVRSFLAPKKVRCLHCPAK